MIQRKSLAVSAAHTKYRPHRPLMRRKSGLVEIRPINIADFEFIRSLAAKTKGYTVCPPYILWMLSRFQPELCVVAQEAGYGPVGYMLALPVGVRTDAVFVWQLACDVRGRRLDAPAKLVRYLKTAISKQGVGTLFFTTIPGSRAERDVKSLAERVLGALPALGPRVPELAGAKEHEYRLLIRTQRR